MRLAYVCTDPGVPVYGSKGGSIHVQEVLRALIAKGVEVVLFARRVGGDTPRGLESVALRRLDRAPSGQTQERERFLLDANVALRDALAAEPELDMVYERHALWSYAAMEYAASAGLPGVLEVNAPLVDEQARYRKLHMVEEAEAAAQRCWDSAGSLLAVSAPLAAWLRDRVACPERVHAVPNGVDTARFGSHVTKELPADAGTVTIGFVGSLRPWHGVERLVAAFLRLWKEGLPVRLLIVGDGPMLERIEEDCKEAAAAVVLTGSVTPDRVPGLLASMDIAVAPYPRLESFYFSPLKLFEYMAAGLAIVASACGQVQEVILDGETGVLFEPDDADGLCAALRRLATDAALREQLGEQARQTAEQEHKWELVAESILARATNRGGAAV